MVAIIVPQVRLRFVLLLLNVHNAMAIASFDAAFVAHSLLLSPSIYVNSPFSLTMSYNQYREPPRPSIDWSAREIKRLAFLIPPNEPLEEELQGLSALGAGSR